jgi:trimeric autotransporter adhesin
MQLSAVADRANGVQEDVTQRAQWSSSNDRVATVSPSGMVEGVGAGNADVGVAFEGVSGTLPFSVSAPAASSPPPGATPPGAVRSVSLRGPSSVPAGEYARLSAVATMGDGSERDVTSAATWTSSNPAVATVEEGVVTGRGIGQATITGAYQGASADVGFRVDAPNPAATISSIAVSGNTAPPVGESSQLAATARMNDGSQQDITGRANWSVGNPAIATITAGGLMTGIGPGQTSVSASYNGVTGQTPVQIAPPVPAVQGLTISGNSNVGVGEQSQLTASARMSDGSTVNVTNQAGWSASNNLVDISADGRLTGRGVGNSTITATYGGQSAQIQANVQPTASVPPPTAPTLQGLTILADSDMKLLGSQQLRVNARYSDGSTSDVTSAVTWTSSNPLVGPVSGSGLLQGLAIGETTVGASYQGQSAQRTVRVSP